MIEIPYDRNTQKPVRKQGIIIQEIGHETLLYDAQGKTVHVLNPTAKLIWQLCDGAHTAEDMEQTIRSKFSVASDHDVSADIQRTLAVFVDKGVLAKKL
ncbi:MAG: PqqD family peptide modification chaperone [Candidatus Brocadia sp.]|nr:PqqD family peptide modification chaperone [Candidatus Brocadia sp.]